MDSNIASPVSRVINLGKVDFPPTPKLDRIVKPSISDPTIYNGKLIVLT
jgi:hypothetical protein